MKNQVNTKKLERQRELLEQEINQSEDLSSPEIMGEIKKLNLILNEYASAIRSLKI
ncbi:sporulation protein Spo0E [Clostridium kluyveri]|uniref:sporulation protein Spo0E n=1 Tax=Clostridium kluyveri TaxID=1534 RepID=UPI0022469B39|nr:sporulation protein Spo0E [Clostridium kluyveri]UZQ49882.1 sporulation protein Spo0E [Clostridium kluyveri]